MRERLSGRIQVFYQDVLKAFPVVSVPEAENFLTPVPKLFAEALRPFPGSHTNPVEYVHQKIHLQRNRSTARVEPVHPHTSVTSSGERKRLSSSSKGKSSGNFLEHRVGSGKSRLNKCQCNPFEGCTCGKRKGISGSKQPLVTTFTFTSAKLAS